MYEDANIVQETIIGLPAVREWSIQILDCCLPYLFYSVYITTAVMHCGWEQELTYSGMCIRYKCVGVDVESRCVYSVCMCHVGKLCVCIN